MACHLYCLCLDGPVVLHVQMSTTILVPDDLIAINYFFCIMPPPLGTECIMVSSSPSISTSIWEVSLYFLGMNDLKILLECAHETWHLSSYQQPIYLHNEVQKFNHILSVDLLTQINSIESAMNIMLFPMINLSLQKINLSNDPLTPKYLWPLLLTLFNFNPSMDK